MQFTDQDPEETREWLDSLDSVIRHQGEERAAYLLKKLLDRADQVNLPLPRAMTTPFRNTIPVTREKRMPGDLFMERRIRSLIRWPSKRVFESLIASGGIPVLVSLIFISLFVP